jgi:PKD repeat protein
MILKRLILVLLAMFLVMGCAGAVSAEETSASEVNETLSSVETTTTPIPPIIDSFNGNLSSGSAPMTVLFTYSGTNVDSYSLDFGDGESDSSPSTGVEHTYTAVGQYIANLTATNTNGTVYQTTTITVTSPLEASFTMSPTSGTAPLEVQFTDTSTGSPNAWNWDFGDNYSSSSQSPTHSFSNAGTYVVNLTVSKGDTQSTVSHNIVVSPTPTLINITSLSVTGLTVPVFDQTPDSSISVSGGGTPVSVSWSPSVSSTFADNTTYMVTITIGNASGYIFNSTTPTVTLNGNLVYPSHVTLNPSTQLLTITHTFEKTESKILPTITLSTNITNNIGTVPLSVKFTYTATNFDNCTLIYGDGASSHLTSSSGNITHTYTTAGSYTASLIAKNLNGTTYENRSITVNKVGLAAAFTASHESGMAPLVVLFIDKSAGSPIKWVWDFGGLGSSMDKNPTFNFTKAGTYIVKLTVIDSTGATDSYSRVISVKAPLATSTPTQTAAVKSLTTASAETGNMSMIPAPLDIIKEFMHLFYSIFDPANYLFAVNESGNTS